MSAAIRPPCPKRPAHWTSWRNTRASRTENRKYGSRFFIPISLAAKAQNVVTFCRLSKISSIWMLKQSPRWQSEALREARYSHYSSGSQTVVRVPLMVREGFSGGTQAAFLSYSKSFVNSFLCYNSFVCSANVANSFICYINLKYILSKLRSSETKRVHSNIKKTSGGTRSQKVWESLHYSKVAVTTARIHQTNSGKFCLPTATYSVMFKPD